MLWLLLCYLVFFYPERKVVAFILMYVFYIYYRIKIGRNYKSKIVTLRTEKSLNFVSFVRQDLNLNFET